MIIFNCIHLIDGTDNIVVFSSFHITTILFSPTTTTFATATTQKFRIPSCRFLLIIIIIISIRSTGRSIIYDNMIWCNRQVNI
ncbi:unnamed protein product [Schistosoma margrebowiei]|uniref:Uncharacterized protein n=1 Tax=Schistosoma margrebowiei TaxID=48269 RepID=A0A3P7ZM34_9TREM|nr:unnamed protein product [Schistosoma margrebowiei]